MHKKILNSSNLRDLLFLGVLYYYLISFFPSSLIFSDTIITGGDTASHFSAADYLVRYLLPDGKIIGWFPGNYGGFPVFIYYFPPLYLLSAVLNLFYPLTVSFKLVTLVGPLLLPICSYLMLRLFRMAYPAPLFAAASSLLFLFNSSNSMWGGNIYSTLAGEFSYAMGFSLTFLFFGLIFDLSEKIKATPEKLHLKEVIISALVFSLVGISHGFTLILSVVSSIFFLLCKEQLLKKALSLFLIFATGSLLFAWWFVPLFFNLPYTTQFEFSWVFTKSHELLPPILIPGLVLFGLYSLLIIFSKKFSIVAITAVERRAMMFIWFVIAVCLVAFFNSDKLHTPDIRFLPFIQYLVTVMGFSGLGFVVSKFCKNRLSNALLIPAALFISVYYLIEYDFANNPNKWKPGDWIKWNYQGYQNAPQWNTFNTINKFLLGSFQDPRVVFEHNDNINNMGSTRAFENLPIFAARATLEGLYFQSSLLSPFVFYLQSLYSLQKSCPFPEYHCSELNLSRAYSYLKLMNVSQLILQTDQAKNQARDLPELYEQQLAVSETPYEIWKMKGDSQYVEVLDQEPEYIAPENFRFEFYDWFTKYQDGKKLLYTVPNKYRFMYDINSLPLHYKKVADADNKPCVITEQIENEVISFTTSCPGRPHLLKFAYNPGWRVKGAVGPYLASPAFMLLYPTENNVSLEYDPWRPKLIGRVMTYLGLLLVLVIIVGIIKPK